MASMPVPFLTPEQYLALDRAAELKSEYHDGEMFPFIAVSRAHAKIAFHLGMALENRLDGGACEFLLAPFRVRVTPTKFLYPDVIVTCGGAILTDEEQDTLTNPKVIFEVLSPSTANYDSSEKFYLYCKLPSFEEYCLVSQDQYRIETRRKQPDGSWILRVITGLDALLEVQSLGLSIPFAEIYRGLSLTPPPE